MNARYYRPVILSALVVALLTVFPPFHIRKLHGSIVPIRGAGSSSIASVARQYWDSSLVERRVPPTELRVLLGALSHNPAEGGRPYGKRPGIGGPLYYFVSGEARIAAVDDRGVWLDTGPENLRAVLQTGPIFGSALRDATGLIRFEDFSSFDFNELSAQLNRLSENLAQPALRREARVGAQLEFLAAGRLNTSLGDGRTLLLAPIAVTVK